jgi:hypothetical protein
MKTDFILHVDKDLLKKAKDYARDHHTTLPKLIEDFLKDITKPGEEITPLVKSLSGIVKLGKMGNLDKDYADYLMGKYQ